MATITINSSDYETYADVATADEYLAGDFGATRWQAEADDDSKGRALVTATRILDRMCWLGDKAVAAQLLAWPRTGTGLSDIDDDEIPQDVIDASVVLAKLIHAGSTVDSTPSTASNIKRQQAGSVSIEYFRPGESPTRLPIAVHEMIKRYFCGGGYAGVIASGVDGCSAFNPGYDIGAPF